MLHLVCYTSDESGDFRFAYLKLDSAKNAPGLLAYEKLYKHVKNADSSLYCLEFFDSSVEYGNELGLPAAREILDEHAAEWLSVPTDPQLEQEFSYRVATCKATDSGILWSASPKHGSDYFETAEISWEDLRRAVAGHNPFRNTQEDK